MKFKKLIIRNIASIRDAVIDFDADPLASSRIFLINGPTGSGKSTILDAICLALYNNAPRLSEYGNRSVSTNITDVDSDVRLGDALSLVRKGASEAFVDLEFEGNDSRVYHARWEGVFSLKNTKNRAKGTLIGYDHNLVTSDGEIIKLKVKGRTNLLSSPEYVGMNFDQFKRTTLLAQGEFSRFLSADPAEKCSILENLSGVKRFGEYGRRIHQRYVQADAELKRLTDRLGGITLFSPEVMEQKRAEQERLTRESSEKAQAIETLRVIKSWFDTEASIAESMTRQKALLDAAMAEVGNEAFKADEDIVGRWQRLHPIVEADTKIADAEKRQTAVDNELMGLAGELCTIVRSLQAIEAELGEARGTLDEQRGALAAFDSSKTLIDNARVVASRLDDCAKLRKDMARLDRKWAVREAWLVRAEENLEAHTVDSAAAESDLATAQKKLAEVNTALTVHVNSPEGTRLNADTEEQKRITAFLSETKNFVEGMADLKKTVQQMESDNAELERLKKAATERQKAYEADKTAYDVAKAAYDAVLTTTDAVVKALRHELKPGCKCPVCNQTVEIVVPDSVFEAQTAPARIRRDEAEKAMTVSQASLNRAMAEVSVLDKKIKKAQTSIDRDKKRIDDLECDLIERGRVLGLTATTGEDMVNEATERNKQLGESIGRMAAFVSKTRELTDLSTEANKAVIAAQKVADAVGERGKVLAKRRDDIAAAIEARKNEIAAKKASLADYMTELSAYVAVTDATDLAALKKEVVDLAAGYEKTRKEVERAETLVNRLTQTVTNVHESLGDVSAVELNAGDGGGVYPATEIFGYVSAYNTRLGVCRTNKNNVTAELAGLRAQRADALAAVADMDAADIANPTLGKTDKEIEELSARIEKAYKSLNDVRVAYEAILGQSTKHSSQRPETQLDADGAREELENLAAAKTDIDRRLGAVDTELRTDSENRTRHAALLGEIEAAERVCDDWRDLDSNFGNDRFKRIVCSYILADLVTRANHYMMMFRPRYSMVVEPGNLEILVRDSEMGSTRVFNTLSGGETFMTSLSLALGLASMNSVGFTADTIFIDEGFGTLSSDCLETVMDSLDRLRRIEHRRIGIISHVESLRDRIPVQIVLRPVGTYSNVDVQ